jgi:S1-C subfamily serine protease
MRGLLLVILMSMFFSCSTIQTRLNAKRSTSVRQTESIVRVNALRLEVVCVSQGKCDMTQQKGTGTGFVINDRKNYIVTNFHVVEDSVQTTVTIDGKEFNTTPVKYFKEDDIAVLEVVPVLAEDMDIRALKLSQDNNVGQDVKVVGYPIPKSVVLKGKVSANEKFDFRKPTYVQLSVSLYEGFSGGPIINTKGEVVGMSTFTIGYNGIGYGITSQYLFNKIKKYVHITKRID